MFPIISSQGAGGSLLGLRRPCSGSCWSRGSPNWTPLPSGHTFTRRGAGWPRDTGAGMGFLQLSDLPQHPTQGPSSSSSSSSRWAGSWSCVPRVLFASGVLPFSPAGFWQGEVSGKTGCRECCLPRAQLGLPKGPRRTQRWAHVGLNCTSASFSLPKRLHECFTRVFALLPQLPER